MPSSSVFTPLWSRRKKAVLVFTSYGSKSRGHQFGSAASGSKSENAHKKRELLGLALGFTYKALRRIRARSSIASGSAARKRSTASSGCGSCKDILPCHDIAKIVVIKSHILAVAELGTETDVVVTDDVGAVQAAGRASHAALVSAKDFVKF